MKTSASPEPGRLKIKAGSIRVGDSGLIHVKTQSRKELKNSIVNSRLLTCPFLCGTVSALSLIFRYRAALSRSMIGRIAEEDRTLKILRAKLSHSLA